MGLLWIWGGAEVSAQNQLPTLDASYNGLSWARFVARVEQAYALQIFYQPDSLDGLIMEVEAGESLLAVLQKNLEKRGYVASFRPPNQLFLTKGAPLVFELPEGFWQVAPPLVSPPEPDNGTDFVTTQAEAAPPTQTVGVRGGTGPATLSGQLTQAIDGSPVIGASVMIKELETGTLSNSQGLYTLKVPPGTYTLIVRSLNFQELTLSLDVQGSGRLDLDLEGRLLELDGVELTARADNHVAKTQMGVERVSIAQI
ncbi:MAG: carboxypeptidase-like regulatory domain-containing protein, partial [Bacteroidetes bacterium]